MPIETDGTAPVWGVAMNGTPCPACQSYIYVRLQYNAPNGVVTVWYKDVGPVDGNSVYYFQGQGYGGSTYVGYLTYNHNQVIANGALPVFTILGRQPSSGQIDASLSGPWFWSSVINQESGYRQFRLTASDIYGISVGYPLFSSDGYGTGLTQIDPRSHTLGNGDFWYWPSNLYDGNIILNNSYTPAYNFWNSQITQMQNENPGTYPGETDFSYCQFAYPQGGVHSYGDAEWINAYNGTGGNGIYPAGYFIYWQNAVNGNPGYWVIKSGVRTYVSDVCSTSPV